MAAGKRKQKVVKIVVSNYVGSGNFYNEKEKSSDFKMNAVYEALNGRLG